MKVGSIMKMSKQIVDNRQKKILEMIEKLGDVRVDDIAEFLQVSKMTIRRDLQKISLHYLPL